MGRTLLILRHGKSLRGPEYATDFERPLAPRGIQAAKQMGRFIKQRGLIPQLILSSRAVRALSTAELLLAELPEAKLVPHPEIYNAAVSDLHEVINELDDKFNRVMLVGHNPTFELFVDDLLGGFDGELKTCSLAVIECPSDAWWDVSTVDCKLAGLYHPRHLPE
jgi:phosphohistidine phosphatase